MSYANTLRKNQTDAEKRLWHAVRNRQLSGFKFRRQQPFPPYVVDFVCLEQRLIVELDGGQHAEQQSYDSERTLWLSTQGFKVLRFWNNEVFENLGSVLDVILGELQGGADTPHPNPLPQGERE